MLPEVAIVVICMDKVKTHIKSLRAQDASEVSRCKAEKLGIRPCDGSELYKGHGSEFL